MDQKYLQSISHPQHSDHQSFVDVDEKWIVNIDSSIYDLLVCQVCCQLITQPIQCAACDRLFCRRDYYAIKRSTNNCCPICRALPFQKKQSIHLTNKALYQCLKFRCQLCRQKKQQRGNHQYSFKQLVEHLSDKHKQSYTEQELYVQQYILKFDEIFNDMVPNISHELSLYQNLQIQYLKKTKHKNAQISILDESYGTILLDFATGTFTTKRHYYGIIKSKFSKRIKVGQEYIAWAFENDGNPEQFYSESDQWNIEDHYQLFTKKKDLSFSQLNLVNKSMYLIDLQHLTQTNTHTKYRRKIKRICFKVEEK